MERKEETPTRRRPRQIDKEEQRKNALLQQFMRGEKQRGEKEKEYQWEYLKLLAREASAAEKRKEVTIKHAEAEEDTLKHAEADEEYKEAAEITLKHAKAEEDHWKW